jgi:copper chaperone CopZ
MKTELLIKGTHCASCKALIEDVAKDTRGITSCTVDFATGKTVIEHDASVDWAAFDKEVAALGEYHVIRNNTRV